MATHCPPFPVQADEPTRTRSLADQIAARRKLLTIPEVADLLSVAKTTIYDMAKAGKIRTVRIGSSVRIDPKHLADYLRSVESIRTT